MDQSEKSQIERLVELAEEAEQLLARSIGSHEIRHACAVARGYLDLARSYNEPVNIEDVERVLARMREALGNKISPPRMIGPQTAPVSSPRLPKKS